MQYEQRQNPNRTPYPSDLSDRQWRAVEVVIPPEKDRGRHRSSDVREIVNGINYRWSTGCVWRMLPHDFPPWATVYTYFRNWQRDGTLREIRQALLRRQTKPRPDTNRKPSLRPPMAAEAATCVSAGGDI